MRDTAEAIIRDVQPCALFKEEGITHRLVGAFTVDTAVIIATDRNDPDVRCSFVNFATCDKDKIIRFHFLVRFYC